MRMDRATLISASKATKQIKLKQSTGALTKRYTPTEIKHATQTLIKDLIGASLGFVGSSTVQGQAQSIALGLYEEFGE